MAKARKAKVCLADRAVMDLQEIESYTIGKWGDAQAAKYLDAFDRFFSLVESEAGGDRLLDYFACDVWGSDDRQGLGYHRWIRDRSVSGCAFHFGCRWIQRINSATGSDNRTEDFVAVLGSVP